MAGVNAPGFKVTLGTTEFSGNLKSAVQEILVEQVSDGASDFKVVLHDYNNRFSDGNVEIKEGMSALIELGYGDATKKVIEGIITGVKMLRHEGNCLRYVVTGFDGLQALSRGRKRRSWEQIKDSDIAADIAGECGLEADVEDSGIINPYVAQNNQTNLDFLFDRAKRIGFELKVEEKRLVFKKPDFTSESIATFYWNKKDLANGDKNPLHLSRCNIGSSTRGVVSKVIVRSYDVGSAKEIIGSAESLDGGAMGGTGTAIDAAASNNPDTTIQISNIPVASQEEAERVAASILNARANEFMTGSARCDGSADLSCGKKVTFKGIGSVLDGEYYITSAKHSFRAGSSGVNTGYWTEFTVARSGR